MDRFLFAAAAALVVTGALVLVAPRIGWLDPRPGSTPIARKTQRLPAAPVGGSVLLSVAALSLGPTPALLAVALAFALGTLDDLLADGLTPVQKLVGQALAAAPLAATGEPLAALLAIVAMNVVNTFDNSDGAVAGFGLGALAPVMPAAAGALLGFLPWNLRRGSAVAPKAYLGDAGSHALGIWIAATPAAWPALALPLFDLAWVVTLRLRAGQRPWTGDRRHLPQALESPLPRPWLRVTVVAAAAAPATLVGPVPLGVALTLVAFVGLSGCVRGDRGSVSGADG